MTGQDRTAAYTLSEREREWLHTMPTWFDVLGATIEGKHDALTAERDRYREALEDISRRWAMTAAGPAGVARAALGGRRRG